MILICVRCKDRPGPGATYQNQRYGHGKRVHNALSSKGGSQEYRCTLCGSTQNHDR